MLGRRRRRKTPRAVVRSLIRELPNLIKLVLRLLRDPRVPGLDRALFALVLAYVVTPFDLLPDFLGAFGLVDDIYLLGLAFNRLFANAGADVLVEHWDGDPEDLGYLVEGIDHVGAMLPAPVRGVLEETVGKRRRRRRRPRRDA